MRFALAFLMLSFAHSAYSETSGQIRICSYNIRYANPGDGEDFWPHRASAVAGFLKDFDLIGLQEVTLEQLEDLKQSMPGFTFYGVGRDDGKSKGEHVILVYRTDRFDSLDQGTIWLSKTPTTAGSKGWDAALPRTLTWTVLKDRQDGKEYWIANTHFDHRGAQARSESGKLVARFAKDQSDGRPVIVMGDFNCLIDSEPYREITQQLRDPRKMAGVTVTGPTSTWNGFRSIAPDRIIDHFFVSDSVEVTELNVADPKTSSGRFASDHLPVILTIR